MATSPSAMASAVEIAIKIVRRGMSIPKGSQREMLERQLVDTLAALRAIDRDREAYRELAAELAAKRGVQ